MTDENQLQTLQLLSDAFALRTRLRRLGVWIPCSNISDPFAYLWSNVHGLESHWNRGQFTYKVTNFGATGAKLTLKTLPLNETTESLGKNVKTSWKRRIFYILVLTGDRSLLMGVQSCHNTAGLDKMLLKNSSVIISTKVALSCS